MTVDLSGLSNTRRTFPNARASEKLIQEYQQLKSPVTMAIMLRRFILPTCLFIVIAIQALSINALFGKIHAKTDTQVTVNVLIDKRLKRI